MIRTLTILLSMLLASCGSDVPETAQPQPSAAMEAESIAFTNASIWDGTGAAPVHNATLVIRDGRVVDVGAVMPPDGARIVDMAGRWIVPGFINAHGHISGRWAEGETLANADAVRADLALYARYGVSTVLSLGGIPGDAYTVRDDQGSSSLDHARLLLAGDIVFTQDPVAAKEMTEANVAAGVDWIKIRIDDNLGTADKMNWEAVGAAMAAAAEAGTPVATHIFYMDDAARLLEMGTGLIAHSVRDRPVSGDFVRALRDSGVCYVPTLVREVSTYVYSERPAFFDDPFFLEAASQSEIDRVSDPVFMARMAASPAAAGYRKALVQAQANLKALHDGGVPIAFGTDSGPAGRFPGYFEHMEFDLMRESGLSPEDILLSATSAAADCLDLPDSGTLESGKWADFVVLEDNPLEDIAALHQIADVYVAGNRLVR